MLIFQAEEQLCEVEPDNSTCDLVKSEIASIGGDSSASEPCEDLLEGDLGLGTAATAAAVAASLPREG